MKNTIISIIIPVYNNALYLPRCIESILKQTYPFFELILIDDGSNDKSYEICKKYALQDSRIRVFHQSNNGVSSARNKGLCESNGKYVCFIDSDDWIKFNFLEKLLIYEFPIDSLGLVIQGADVYNMNKEFVKSISFQEELLVGEQMKKAFTDFELYLWGAPWSKLYNLHIIKENNLNFNESLHYGEDLLFMFQYIKHINYIQFSSEHNYVYNIIKNSLSNRNRSYYIEKQCYESMKENLFYIEKRFNLNHNSLKKMEFRNSIFLIRALTSLYKPPYIIPSNRRLKEIYSLTNYDLNLIQNTEYNYRLFEKIGRFFLKLHLFRLYDTYMYFIYYICYNIKQDNKYHKNK